MNNERRKEIAKAIHSIESVIQDILSDEEEAYDNMPESLQGSERGIASEEAQDSLSAAIEALEEAVMCLEEASY